MQICDWNQAAFWKYDIIRWTLETSIEQKACIALILELQGSCDIPIMSVRIDRRTHLEVAEEV